MGTRADFYVGVGFEAEWIGSVAYDGDWFACVAQKRGSHPDARIMRARTEASFRRHVAAMLAKRDDAIFPDMGWPWPWPSSTLSDCVYAFTNRRTRYFFDDTSAVEWPIMTVNPPEHGSMAWRGTWSYWLERK